MHALWDPYNGFPYHHPILPPASLHLKIERPKDNEGEQRRMGQARRLVWGVLGEHMRDGKTTGSMTLYSYNLGSMAQNPTP